MRLGQKQKSSSFGKRSGGFLHEQLKWLENGQQEVLGSTIGFVIDSGANLRGAECLQLPVKLIGAEGTLYIIEDGNRCLIINTLMDRMPFIQRTQGQILS